MLNYPYLSSLLGSCSFPNKEKLKIKLLCNWLSSKDLCDLWNKMSKGNYTWNDIVIVWEGECDYWVIINRTEDKTFIKEKTILIRMEPHMDKHPELWGEEWSNPKGFYKVISPPESMNNLEWHLSLNYNFLSDDKIIIKDDNTKVSTVLSYKFHDPGHKFRVSFVKYLETKEDIIIDVYGDNTFNYKNYKGTLPYHSKDKGIIPYKYTFNAENNSIKNYITEKLIDAILGECYCFYWGCPNIEEIIDPRCYTILDEDNFEDNYLKIKEVIEGNIWGKNIDVIRSEKRRILNELSFFPRIEKILKG